MAKEGIKGTQNQRDHYVKICNIVNGDVSAEVIATDYEGMIREGDELAALNPHIVVKVPCIADGIKAIKYFTEKEYARTVRWSFRWDRRCWRLSGATYVSPFVGRLDDICEDGIDLSGILYVCTARMITRRKCWQLLSVIRSTLSNVWKWGGCCYLPVECH